MSRPHPMLATGVLTALTAAGAAQAHARLMSSSPAAGATGAAPAEITLKFSEAPMAKFSRLELTDAAGGAVPVKPAKAADRDTLAVAPDAPLKPGVYKVKWRAVADDMHRTQGGFSFTVR